MDRTKVEALARILADEASHDEVRQNLQVEVDQLDRPGSPCFHFVVEVFEGYFVYEARCQEGLPTKFYRQGYTAADDDGEVTLEGDPVEVVKETSYVEA